MTLAKKMIRSFAALTLGAALVAPLGTVAAIAADWQVSKLVRTVDMSRDGRKWVRLARGQAVPPNSFVRTASGARLQLRRGRDVITVTPGTQVWIASRNAVHSRAKLTIARGKVKMDVKKGVRKRVSIVTKHIAAVVKGTTLTVGAGRFSSSVSVQSGIVDVSTPSNNRTVTLTAGQSISSTKFREQRNRRNDGDGSRDAPAAEAPSRSGGSLTAGN